MEEQQETNLELNIYISYYKNDTRSGVKDDNLHFYKEYESGFFAQYMKENEDDNTFIKGIKKEYANCITELIKNIEGRTISISPNSYYDWCPIFKNDIAEFGKLINDERFLKIIDKVEHNLNLHLHFGIQYLKESLARNTTEEENCEKYKGWKFILIEFPFDLLGPKQDEILAKQHIYRDYRYEESHLIFFFQEFTIDILFKIFDLYDKIKKIEYSFDDKLNELSNQLLADEKVNENFETIIANF